MPKAGLVTTVVPVAAMLLFVLVTPRTGRAADEDDPVQDPHFPSIGARVRVTSSALPSAREVGTLSGIDRASLAFRLQNRADAVVLEPSDIHRLERSVRPSRKKKGTLIGLGVGFGVGFLGTGILCALFGDGCPTGEGIAYGTIYGLATGALGAAVGAIVSPGEHWAEVPLSRIPSGANAEPRSRVQLGLTPIMGTTRGLTLVASF